jgi:hypothetical protein
MQIVQCHTSSNARWLAFKGLAKGYFGLRKVGVRGWFQLDHASPMFDHALELHCPVSVGEKINCIPPLVAVLSARNENGSVFVGISTGM